MDWATILISTTIGIAIGAVGVVLAKFQIATNWNNKELDGTIFIVIILMAFCGTIVGTYIKESFAKLETTKELFGIFENLFMIIVGYLFKKAVDAVQSNGGGK